MSLTQKQEKSVIEITGGSPAMRIANPEPAFRAETVPKAEARSLFWCQACGAAISTCAHRVVYAPPPERPRRRA